MQDPSAFVPTISKAVAEARSKALTGARLRAILKSAHPEFEPQEYAKNLRAFVREFVPDVIEKGRAGADVVYGSSSPESDTDEQMALFELASKTRLPHAPLESLLIDQRVWKTFASPQSPWRLLLDPQTGSVRVIRPSEAAPAGSNWVEVPPCPAETLLQIAKDFVASVPETVRVVLINTLQEKKWWLPFFDVLQAVGLRTKWIAYRRRRIVAEFERMVTTIIRETVSSQPGDRPQIRAQKEQESTSPPSQSIARSLAMGAVARMTEAELRSLNLPLGHIIDSLNIRS